MLFTLPLLLCLAQAPEWDVKAEADKLSREILELQPMVEQIRIDRWTGPDAGRFENRKQSALAGIRAVHDAALGVAAAPDKLAVTTGLLARLDGLLLDLNALAFGFSRFQSGAMGDVVYAAVERFSIHRESLRKFVEEAAAAREAEFAVAFKEAQRCREQLSRPAPPRHSDHP